MATKKELAHYFPHDSNARNSDKLIRLRMRHKSAGYGVYFMILERLREEPEYMSVKDYNMIAFDLREDASLIKSVVEDFGLFVFTDDGKYFYSESFSRRMEIKDEQSKKRSEAGKKGLEKRWKSNKDMANATNNDSKAIANATESNSNKKEIKENKEISPEGDTKNNAPDGASLLPELSDTSEVELSVCRQRILADTYWIETFCMNNSISIEQFNKAIDIFFKTLQNRGKIRKSAKDAKFHFSSWLNLELQKHNKNGRNKNFTPASNSYHAAAGYGEE